MAFAASAGDGQGFGQKHLSPRIEYEPVGDMNSDKKLIKNNTGFVLPPPPKIANVSC
jgi:hypothetical protein